MNACRARTGQTFYFTVTPILLAFGWCAINMVPIISLSNSTKLTWSFHKSDLGRHMVAIVKSTSVFFCSLSKDKSLEAPQSSTRANRESISRRGYSSSALEHVRLDTLRRSPSGLHSSVVMKESLATPDTLPLGVDCSGGSSSLEFGISTMPPCSSNVCCNCLMLTF